MSTTTTKTCDACGREIGRYEVSLSVGIVNPTFDWGSVILDICTQCSENDTIVTGWLRKKVLARR
jgi:hypothetical protein